MRCDGMGSLNRGSQQLQRRKDANHNRQQIIVEKSGKHRLEIRNEREKIKLVNITDTHCMCYVPTVSSGATTG